jgi:hypothetical protein
MRSLLILILSCLCVSAQAQQAFFVPSNNGTEINGGGGGPLVIQHAWKGVSGSANNVAVTVAPAAGNLLVLCAIEDTAGISSVSDNIDGATGWIQVFDYAPTSTHLGCWYKKNLPAGITTVTVTATGGQFITAIFHEVSGASTSAPFTTGEFATKNNNSNTTNPQTSALVNATPNSILFALCDDFSSSANPITMTINGTGTSGTYNLFSTSNSQELNAIANDALSVANIIVSSSASQIHGWTTANDQGTTAIVAFH